MSTWLITTQKSLHFRSKVIVVITCVSLLYNYDRFCCFFSSDSSVMYSSSDLNYSHVNLSMSCTNHPQTGLDSVRLKPASCEQDCVFTVQLLWPVKATTGTFSVLSSFDT